MNGDKTVKKENIAINKDHSCSVFHADLWGLREEKYKTLLKSDISETAWETLHPQSPFHLFVPQDISLFKEYENWHRNLLQTFRDACSFALYQMSRAISGKPSGLRMCFIICIQCFTVPNTASVTPNF